MRRCDRRYTVVLIACATGGCVTTRPPAPCDPTVTPSRSTLAWSPALPNQPGAPSGRVIDASTGAPLGGALISVEPAHFALQSDSVGEFTLPGLSHATHHVRVRKIGYMEAQDSVKHGMGGLRLVAVLAPSLGLVDFACVVPVR